MVSAKPCDAKTKWACGHMAAKAADTLQPPQKREGINNTPDMYNYGYEVDGAQHKLHKTGGVMGKGKL